jgi:hypothetical protein
MRREKRTSRATLRAMQQRQRRDRLRAAIGRQIREIIERRGRRLKQERR